MLSKAIFDFKPHKIGLKKVLGDLEADIMDIVWNSGEVTVRHVYELLRPKKKLAYTTVMTVMKRLVEKKFLNRDTKGTAYIYTCNLTETEFTYRVVAEVLDGLLEGFGDSAISHIIDRLCEQDVNQLNKLEQLIQERRAYHENII